MLRDIHTCLLTHRVTEINNSREPEAISLSVFFPHAFCFLSFLNVKLHLLTTIRSSSYLLSC